MPDATAVAAMLDALPVGTVRGRSLGRDWLVTRSLFAGGASETIVARAVDGEGYVSANLYRRASGPACGPAGCRRRGSRPSSRT